MKSFPAAAASGRQIRAPQYKPGPPSGKLGQRFDIATLIVLMEMCVVLELSDASTFPVPKPPPRARERQLTGDQDSPLLRLSAGV